MSSPPADAPSLVFRSLTFAFPKPDSFCKSNPVKKPIIPPETGISGGLTGSAPHIHGFKPTVLIRSSFRSSCLPCVLQRGRSSRKNSTLPPRVFLPPTCPAVLSCRACLKFCEKELRIVSLAAPKNSWNKGLRIVSIVWVSVFFIVRIRDFWGLGLEVFNII